MAPPTSLQAILDEADAAPAKQLEELETRPVTRDGAILFALGRNKRLAIERLSPAIAETFTREAWAEFDPRLTALASFTKSPQVRDGDVVAMASSERQSRGQAELRQLTPLGAEVFLAGALQRERVIPEPSDYQTAYSFGVNMALLDGAGLNVNLVDVRQTENDVAASMAELRGFVMDLVAEVEILYWELALAEETLKIREASLELAHEQERLNRDLFEVGKALEADVMTAEAEVASRIADLADARALLRQRMLQFIRLLSPDSPEQWDLRFDILDEPTTALVSLQPQISAKLAHLWRPELAQARLDLANADLEIVRTKNGLLPRLDAFASYSRRAIGGSASDSFQIANETEAEGYQVGLAFDMALLNRAERARHRRAMFRQAQAEEAIRNLEELLEMEVRTALIEVQRQWERIGATEKVVEGRREQLRAAQEQAVAGLLPTLDALQIQRDFVQAQVDAATARIRYVQAVTELYRREGTLLDRRGVGSGQYLTSN